MESGERAPQSTTRMRNPRLRQSWSPRRGAIVHSIQRTLVDQKVALQAHAVVLQLAREASPLPYFGIVSRPGLWRVGAGNPHLAIKDEISRKAHSAGPFSPAAACSLRVGNELARGSESEQASNNREFRAGPPSQEDNLPHGDKHVTPHGENRSPC